MKMALFLLLATLSIGAFLLHRADQLDADSSGLLLRGETPPATHVYNVCVILGGHVDGPFVAKGKSANEPAYQCRTTISWVLIGTIVVGLAVVVGFATMVR